MLAEQVTGLRLDEIRSLFSAACWPGAQLWSRYHSLALVPAPEAALYHFMLEVGSLDDVGYALDRHHDTGTAISMGIGKHTNDRMVSFYSRSPSGFDVEIGCGGLLVDEATWTVAQITKPSFWGHRPPAAS